MTRGTYIHVSLDDAISVYGYNCRVNFVTSRNEIFQKLLALSGSNSEDMLLQVNALHIRQF